MAHEGVLADTETGPRQAAGIEDLVQAPLEVRRRKSSSRVSRGFLKHLCQAHRE
jgi:hypothetical protein